MSDKKEFRKQYATKLQELQIELVKLQDYVIETGKKIAIVFEGRDAAGKGGTIKRITEHLNPRHCKIVALAAPTEREKTQWYYQRYITHLPAAGEIVIFDRSWYNRGGVERVMGFCTDKQYVNFLQTCPEFERMVISSGTQLIKYWFSVSDKEQEKRFQERANNPMKNWKLSPMDLEARNRWVEYSQAKDIMFEHTYTDESPWWVVNGENKRKARLNCIEHLLNRFDYSEIKKAKIELPKRREMKGLSRPPIDSQRFVPQKW